ncbi:MAG TPA: replication-relaxation family protein [Candidatus Limnocylindria bacterium]
MTTAQLQCLHFHDHTTEEAAARICRRVLARLHQLQVVEHLQRRIGGVRAGSASFVWRVGPVGDRLLRQSRGEGGRARRKEPSARHLDHCLAIADCHLALVTAVRTGRLELLRVATEPDSWRSYLSVGGATEVLKPDLYAVTATGEYEDHWFVEVDRATESLPTLLRKCVQYERYRRTGREQAKTGVFPLVVWVVPDEQRAAKLRAALHSVRGLDPDLFRITTPEPFAELVGGGSA